MAMNPLAERIAANLAEFKANMEANAKTMKASAARKNGQKGGWPKGKKRKIGARTYRQVDVNIELGPTGLRLQPAKGTPRKGKGKR